ncbi:MAG: histidinol-phosphatase [Campylobacterota bacterium]|nr:histidinol-phosphatase [Campylobacterota bacterium]
MIVDLHNHTPLCNHANGKLDDYIIRAIESGTKCFGFSDHAPMDFDPKYRMNFKQMELYENEVLTLKKRYKNDIEILLGYEVDYLKNHMDDRVLDAKVDYLIGSVHFIDGWGFDNPEFIGKYKDQDIDEIWQKYFDTIKEMAESKLFDIVGHLDLIKVFKFMPNKNICDIAYDSLVAIKKADMAIEINVAGFRKPIKEQYPSTSLLKLAFELKIPITFGSDAHEPDQVSLFNDEVIQIAKTVGYSECAIFRNRKREFIKF